MLKKINNKPSVLALLLFILSMLMFAISVGATKNKDSLINAAQNVLAFSIIIAIIKPITVWFINKKISDYNSKHWNNANKNMNYTSKNDINFRNVEEELDRIDMFTGVQFEQYIITLLKKEGYFNIESTKASGDYGVDITAQKDGLKCAIQCKRYHNNVPIKAIQEIKSGKTYYKCDKAMVITNSYYTQNAKNLASSIGVQLFDRDDLIRVIKKHNSQ